MRPWAGPISWHSNIWHTSPEKDMVTRDHPLLIQSLVGNTAGHHWPKREAPPCHLPMLYRWRLAVLRPRAWPKVAPEPLHEPDGCWKLELILDAEYSHGLRADFSPCIHTCSTVRAVSLKESISDCLISLPPVSSGYKKCLKISQKSRQLAILY